MDKMSASSEPVVTVREMALADLDRLMEYWYQASEEYLRGMGADIAKLPPRTQFESFLRAQIQANYVDKSAYALLWLVDGQAVGHSNVNQIKFGEQAFMHLHLWQAGQRKRGLGTELVKKSLPFYFERLQLQHLFCEPYAFNPAPNATLAKVGFEFIKQHRCIPGSLNFEQEVKRWKMSREAYLTFNRL